MIRQFEIHLNFPQNFCVHSRPLARSVAHPTLWVLWGLKHGTAVLHPWEAT